MEGNEQKSMAKIESIADSYEKSEILSRVKNDQMKARDFDQVVQDKIRQRKENQTGIFIAFLWLLWRSLITTVCLINHETNVRSALSVPIKCALRVFKYSALNTVVLKASVSR